MAFHVCTIGVSTRIGLTWKLLAMNLGFAVLRRALRIIRKPDGFAREMQVDKQGYLLAFTRGDRKRDYENAVLNPGLVVNRRLLDDGGGDGQFVPTRLILQPGKVYAVFAQIQRQVVRLPV